MPNGTNEIRERIPVPPARNESFSTELETNHADLMKFINGEKDCSFLNTPERNTEKKDNNNAKKNLPCAVATHIIAILAAFFLL